MHAQGAGCGAGSGYAAGAAGGGGGGGFGNAAGGGGFGNAAGGGGFGNNAGGGGFGNMGGGNAAGGGGFGNNAGGGGFGNVGGGYGAGGSGGQWTAGMPVADINDGAGFAVGTAGGCPTGCATGCATAGCATMSTTAMTYVGAGRGDYLVTTSYKFVGNGAGELAFVSRVKPLWSRILGGLFALVALGAAIALLSAPKDTSTTSVEESVGPAPIVQVGEGRLQDFGECTFWGDPHFKTFDGARPSFYGEGELYIVKSDEVQIQGRYEGTKYTMGLAATNKIVVGGSFINYHVLEVGCMESGDITFDGEPILTSFPSEYKLLDVPDAEIFYNTDGELVDKATEMFDERRIVHMNLPLGVRLTVLRWSNYVDFRLRMPPQPEQDGGCGNFNHDPSDDTTQDIFKRDGARVKDTDLLFRSRVQVRVGDTELQLLNICPEERMQEAKEECVQELSSIKGAAQDEVQLKSCYLDVCFGMNEHALQMAKKYHLGE